MTKNELSQLYFLRKEISEQERKIEQLEALATSCSAKLSDMPHGTEKSDKIGKFGAKIVDLKTKLQKNLQKRILEEKKINEFIEDADDAIVRLILVHKYVNCYSWAKIAWKIGGNNTIYGLKMRLHRYLKNKNL